MAYTDALDRWYQEWIHLGTQALYWEIEYQHARAFWEAAGRPEDVAAFWRDYAFAVMAAVDADPRMQAL